jgi:hypothetical protein
MELSDSPPSIPPGFVAFAGRLLPVRPPRSLPRLGDAPWPRTWISWSAGTQPASSWAEMTGPPRFLGRSSWTYAVLFDPGRARCVRPIRRESAVAPKGNKDDPGETSSFEAPSHGLSPRCLRFAGALTRRPRKTRLRLVASLYHAGFAPAGSPTEGFPSVRNYSHRFLLPQALPGALPVRLQMRLQMRAARWRATAKQSISTAFRSIRTVMRYTLE